MTARPYSAPAFWRETCCSAWAASRRACGRSSASTSSTRARFASASRSWSSALRLAPFVAPDAGHFLEQRPPLLGPQRQRLVDHALADEEEGVVGQVGGVEQVDEVLEPDPLLVEQVVVLAGAEEPPSELDRLEVDRQQPVRVAQDERDVGHAEGGSLLGAGEDHVLGLAQAQGAALLAQGPAQRVGEVALAGAVRPHDGADAGAELDDRALAERLEALQPQGEQACRSGHGRLRPHRPRLPEQLRRLKLAGSRPRALDGRRFSVGSAGASPWPGWRSSSREATSSSVHGSGTSGSDAGAASQAELDRLETAIQSAELGQLGRPLRATKKLTRLRPQGLDGLRRGRGLGHAPRVALAQADDAPADGHLDPEDLVVVRPDGVEQPVLRSLAGEALRVLLQSALGALERPERAVAGELGGGQGGHERRWRRSYPRSR